jgi:surface carbohydrate biosynthesis protein
MASADEEARFVIFQNGNRLLSELPSKKSLLPGDVFFCLTDAYVEPLKGSVAGDALIVPSGSLASKLHKLHDLPISQGNTAGYISNWRQGDMLNGELWVTDARGTAVPHSTFYKPEIQLLLPLLQSIQSLGMTLEIIGNPSDDSSEERLFYESILGKEGWSLSPRIGKERSYSKIPLYPILFCVDSTLGYEALSGLKRVMFLDSSSGGGNRTPFGYPSNLEFANSPLHLRNEDLRSWESQIAQAVSMNDPAFTVLADSIVGQAAISMRLVDLSEIVRAILRPGFNGGS